MKSQLEQSPAFAPEQALVVQFGRETALDTEPDSAGAFSHIREGVTLVAPATSVAADDRPGRPCSAHHDDVSPVIFRRRAGGALPCR